jgi:hypothetical protein
MNNEGILSILFLTEGGHFIAIQTVLPAKAGIQQSPVPIQSGNPQCVSSQ